MINAGYGENDFSVNATGLQWSEAIGFGGWLGTFSPFFPWLSPSIRLSGVIRSSPAFSMNHVPANMLIDFSMRLEPQFPPVVLYEPLPEA